MTDEQTTDPLERVTIRLVDLVEIERAAYEELPAALAALDAANRRAEYWRQRALGAGPYLSRVRSGWDLGVDGGRDD